MSLTAAQLAVLKTELTTDPRGYGFVAMSDSDAANALNLVRDGSQGTVPTNPTAAGGFASGIITVRRNDISGQEILQAVDPATDGQTTITALQQEYFNACCGMRTLSFVNPDGSDNAVLSNLKKCFTSAAPATSRTNLGTISKRSGSRAEELFGTGTVLDQLRDVNAARRS